MQPLPDGADDRWIRINFGAMLEVLPQIAAALDHRVQARRAISEAYRDGPEATVA